MQLDQVEDLSPEPARAVVINVGTELVTTLALASALRYSSMPVLLINCDPTPQSVALFTKVMIEWDFDVVNTRRQSHGRTLDGLFRSIKADRLLLVDSDAEIRSAGLIRRMREYLDDPMTFGSGFVQGPGWLGELDGCAARTCLYQERPWLPCVYLRTSDVRDALDAGMSFETRVIYNDFMPSATVSRLLAKRFQNGIVQGSRSLRRLPRPVQDRLRHSQFSWLRWARREFYGLRPNYVYCDTGADIYQWCKHHKGKVFAGLPVQLVKNQVMHYVGVTRKKLDPTQLRGGHLDPHTARAVDIEDEVCGRLRDVYDVDWSQLLEQRRS